MDFENRDYDLALFHIEQFEQLYSKYLLYKRIGDYPKTRSLLRLLSNLVRIYGDCGLREFIDKYLEGLYLLEDAYISTHYLPRAYDEYIAKRILLLADNLLEAFKCLESKS